MSEPIVPASLEVLRACWCEGNIVKLPPAQLPREVYEGVKEPLERIRGKWKGGKTNGFVFDFDPAPLLTLVQQTGEMPPKNPTAYFPTPPAVVAEIVKAIDINVYHQGIRVLEPSAGGGAICDGLKAAFEAVGTEFEMDCVEYLDLNRARLIEKGYRVVGEDFTLFSPNRPYDLVCMNPPFSLEGDKLAWLTHVERAWGMVKDDGMLVAIIPPALQYRDMKCVDEFWDLAGLYGWWEELPAHSFKESGTGTATAILCMEKTDQSWRDREYQGWPNWHSWLVALYADNDRRSHDEWEQATRQGPDALRTVLEKVAENARKACKPARLKESDHAVLYRHFAEMLGLDVPELQVVKGDLPAQETLGGLFEVAA